MDKKKNLLAIRLFLVPINNSLSHTHKKTLQDLCGLNDG